jgi:hypothetical protein
MHGTKTNTHFLTFKATTHHGLNDDKPIKSQFDQEQLAHHSKKMKPASAYSMADVEKQILDWQDEMRDSKK